MRYTRQRGRRGRRRNVEVGGDCFRWNVEVETASGIVERSVRGRLIHSQYARDSLLADNRHSSAQRRNTGIRYDMRCYFNVRSNADMSQLNVPQGINNKKVEKEKLKSKKTDMLRSIGKQSGEYVESVLKEEKEGYGGKDLQKRKVLILELKSKGVRVVSRWNRWRKCHSTDWVIQHWREVERST